MSVRIIDGLPYTSVTLTHREQTITLHEVVIDTGSAATLFRTEDLLQMGITYSPDDIVEQVRGVGGVETVVVKRLDRLQVGELKRTNFPVDMGAVAYGFDFLQQTVAVIDFSDMEIRPK